MTDGKGLRGTLVTLGVAGLVTTVGLIVLPRLLPASLTAMPQAVRPDPMTAAPAPSEPPPDQSALASPRFDTVRLEADGSGLVAGRADPGSLVFVLLEEDVVAEETADDQGRFVAFLSLAPSDQPRALSLRDEDGTPSDETVILAPTPSPEPAGAVTLAGIGEGAGVPQADTDQMAPIDIAKPGPDLPAAAPQAELAGDAMRGIPVLADPSAEVPLTEGRVSAPVPDVTSDMTDAVPAPADAAGGPELPSSDPAAPATVAAAGAFVAPAPDAPAQPSTVPSADQAAPDLAEPSPSAPADSVQSAVLVSDAEGVRVLQPALPAAASPEILSTVALDAIAYDGSGEVVLTGRAGGTGTVRLYIDNAPVAEAPIAGDGTWTSALGSTGPGVYTLRIDQLDTTGAVVSRIQTPFQREGRNELAAAMAEASKPGQTIAMRTVQPGNTLWAIARDRYGEPTMYVRVFEANRDRIRDADLIYPGQVFVLPATDGR